MNDTEARSRATVTECGAVSVAAQAPRDCLQVWSRRLICRFAAFATRRKFTPLIVRCGRLAGNRKRAAKLLGISHRSLLYKIRQHNITPTVQHS